MKEKMIDQPEKIKFFDFRMPDQLSMDQIQNIAHIHTFFAEIFSKALAQKLDTDVKIEMTAVDQLPFGAILKTLSDKTSFSIFKMSPQTGHAIFEIPNRLIDIMLNLLFGGKGSSENEHKDVTELDLILIEPIINLLLDKLSLAWDSVFKSNFKLQTIETNSDFVMVVPANQMVLNVTCELSLKNIAEQINLIIPFLAIENVICNLTNSIKRKENLGSTRLIDHNVDTSFSCKDQYTISTSINYWQQLQKLKTDEEVIIDSITSQNIIYKENKIRGAY